MRCSAGVPGGRSATVASAGSSRRMPELGDSSRPERSSTWPGVNTTAMVGPRDSRHTCAPRSAGLSRPTQAGHGLRQQCRKAAGARSFQLGGGRPPQQRGTAERLSELAAGYGADQTTYQLAEKYGLNRNTVAAHLGSVGVTIRMDGMTPQQIEQAVECYRLAGPWPRSDGPALAPAASKDPKKAARLHPWIITRRILPTGPSARGVAGLLVSRHLTSGRTS